MTLCRSLFAVQVAHEAWAWWHCSASFSVMMFTAVLKKCCCSLAIWTYSNPELAERLAKDMHTIQETCDLCASEGSWTVACPSLATQQSNQTAAT